MPWLETVPMDQRAQFIQDHQRGLDTVTELGARYGISRKTGYKSLARFEAAGRCSGLLCDPDVLGLRSTRTVAPGVRIAAALASRMTHPGA
jgi:hypothetical protein